MTPRTCIVLEKVACCQHPIMGHLTMAVRNKQQSKSMQANSPGRGQESRLCWDLRHLSCPNQSPRLAFSALGKIATTVALPPTIRSKSTSLSMTTQSLRILQRPCLQPPQMSLRGLQLGQSKRPERKGSTCLGQAQEVGRTNRVPSSSCQMWRVRTNIRTKGWAEAPRERGTWRPETSEAIRWVIY